MAAWHGSSRNLPVVTAVGEFEDHWFFEVDLATEPPSRLIRACLSYQEYRRSGIEQRRLGLFPAVVWIVPTTRRKAMLQARLAAHERISPGLFTVITLDELEDLVQTGPTAEVASPAMVENAT